MARAMEEIQTTRRRRKSGRSHSFELRQFLGIAQEDFARLLDVSVRSVARWEGKGGQPVAEVREKINFLLKLTILLDEMIERKDITDWLTTPNPAFLDQPPVDLIRSKYGRRVIEQEVKQAEWGIPG